MATVATTSARTIGRRHGPSAGFGTSGPPARTRRGQLQPPPALPSSTQAGAAPRRVDVRIDLVGPNSRAIFAGLPVAAPVEGLWRALTDYERLGDFIPGLVENRCLRRDPGGARLLQVGQQEVALGVKFSARCLLEVMEYPGGVPRALCTHGGRQPGLAGKLLGGLGLSGRLPGLPSLPGLPALPGLPGLRSTGKGGDAWMADGQCGYYTNGRDTAAGGSNGGAVPGSYAGTARPLAQQRVVQRPPALPWPRSPPGWGPWSDVAFEAVEGDFQAFKGIWRMHRPLGPQAGQTSSWLSYSLFVQPHVWLPVGLIQDRIEREIVANLVAVRDHVEGGRGGAS